MATISKLTDIELRAARSAGYKAKRPKKPKGGATLTVLENWVGRYNEWVRKAKAKTAEKKAKTTKKDSEVNKRKALKEKISRI